MHAQQPVDVVDVVVEVGHEQQGPIAELGTEPLDAGPIAPGEHVVVVEGRSDASGEVGRQAVTEGVDEVCGVGIAEDVVMDAVDDHAGERKLALGQRALKPDRLLDRVRLSGGHEHERGRSAL